MTEADKVITENLTEADQTALFEKFCAENPQLALRIASDVLKRAAIKVGESDEFSQYSGQSTSNGEVKVKTPRISVVLPIYNEEENISEIYRRVTEALESAGKYEIIFVNDGSYDCSVEMILRLRESDDRVKLLNFSRNFGHQAAISAGIDYSRGDAVILMDADLQDPPEILPNIIREWEAGAQVIYAVREKRKESFYKKVAYFLFYRFLQKISNVDIPLDSGDFCLMDRKVVEHLKSMPERNRFVRGLRSWIGFKQVPFRYERDARFAGDVKYTFRKLMKLAVSGIVSFSSFPLQVATYIGFLTCLAGAIYVLYVVGVYFVSKESPQGWTSLVVLLLLVGGVQLTLLGIIGEYMSRIYDEVKQRPNYIVREFYD